MGYEYEVSVWNKEAGVNTSYYAFYWEGNSFEEAITQMNKAKGEGFKNITLIWRPE